MNTIWTLNWKNVSGAVVSAVLSAVLSYIANLASISNLNWGQVLGIAIIVAASSLLKAFSTDSTGSFVGILPVK